MVKAVKDHKAGFVQSDSTLTPDMTMEQVIALKEKTGHSTMPVTDDGTPRASSWVSSPAVTIAPAAMITKRRSPSS